MGSYIYKISTEVAFEIMVNGVSEKVYKAIYAYKPYYMGWDVEKMNARFERQIVKPTERAFERKGITPKYFVMAYGDKHKVDLSEGAMIYHAPQNGGITFWDDTYTYEKNGAGTVGVGGVQFIPNSVPTR